MKESHYVDYNTLYPVYIVYTVCADPLREKYLNLNFFSTILHETSPSLACTYIQNMCLPLADGADPFTMFLINNLIQKTREGLSVVHVKIEQAAEQATMRNI